MSPINNISRSSIEAAIKEYDKLGKKEFLKHYGYKESKKYYINYNGKEYDSKAIVGVSFKYEFPQEQHLLYDDFSGGKNTVVKLCNKLGFTIVEKSIKDSIIEAFILLKKDSTIDEIKHTIIENNLYDFGAQEKNINDVIRNQIERYCENVERSTHLNSDKFFRKIETNLYKLSQYTIIVENDESKWEDQTGILYHFPNSYVKYLLPGTKVIYYKGLLKNIKYKDKRLTDKAHYFATAEIGEIYNDTNSSKNDKFAIIENYKSFSKPILAKQNEQYLEFIPEEKKNNYWRNGVRSIDLNTYLSIVSKIDKTFEIKNINDNITKKYTDINDIENTFESSIEGQKKSKYVTYYERDPGLREKAIKIHGFICRACGFDFQKMYGEYGKGYIHIHHIKPLSENAEEIKVDPSNDLIPLCANCHSIIHRRKDKTLSLDALIEMIKSANK